MIFIVGNTSVGQGSAWGGEGPLGMVRWEGWGLSGDVPCEG